MGIGWQIGVLRFRNCRAGVSGGNDDDESNDKGHCLPLVVESNLTAISFRRLRTLGSQTVQRIGKLLVQRRGYTWPPDASVGSRQINPRFHAWPPER